MAMTATERPAAAAKDTQMMQAIVAYAPGDYRLETIPIPTPGPLEVLTKVEACGICAGDIKTFHGAPSFWGDKDQPRRKTAHDARSRVHRTCRRARRGGG